MDRYNAAGGALQARYSVIKQGSAYLVFDTQVNRPVTGYPTTEANAKALAERFNADEAIKAARVAKLANANQKESA